MDRETQLSRSVRELQHALDTLSRIDKRIPRVNPDGIFGAATEAAVRAFQSTADLPVTGEVDFATWNALFRAYEAAVRLGEPARGIFPFPAVVGVIPGSAADAILILQVMLRALTARYKTIPLPPTSGVWDAETEAALRAFQKESGIPETGVPDRRTWDLLAIAYNHSHDDT